MITGLDIKNYKCFYDEEFELWPLTLLVGENGTGKSCVIEALQLLSTLRNDGIALLHESEFINVINNPSAGLHFTIGVNDGRYKNDYYFTSPFDVVDVVKCKSKSKTPELNDTFRKIRTASGREYNREVTKILKEIFPNIRKEDVFNPRSSGVSKCSDIIKEGLSMTGDDILLLQNPENDIHPLAQSKIAKFLAELVVKGNQVILETHSDHIFNGIRVAVAKGIIPPDKVQVINFFFNEDKEIDLQYIDITDGGYCSDWPDKFFNQSENDMRTLMDI